MDKLYFLALFLALSACNRTEFPFKAEGESLLTVSKQLNCKEKRFEYTIDSLWDVVSTRLDQVLPDTMPPGRRENMINIRNAPLLKQFKIFYTTLDTVSLNMISRSGSIDSLIASKVLELKVQQEAQEKKVLDFLIKVEQQHPKAYKKWNEKFLHVAKEECN